MDFYNFRKIWNPDWFQGNHRHRNYFEGWYFKLVSPDKGASFAIIPGISIGEGIQSAYAFIQVINGKTGESRFVKFSITDFSFSREGFEVSIAGNKFSGKGISIDLPKAGFGVSGRIYFHDPVPYPVTIISPGVMGWYRFVPTMECYHGIVSMLHTLQGNLTISGESVDFTDGKGYIEKDWGKSMPLAWIWMQSNHFKQDDLSISFSIANIPWRKSSFTGFLIILSAGDRIYRFTTYTGAKINQLSLNDGLIEMEVSNRKYILSVSARGNVKGNLKAPVDGEMSRTIHESIDSSIRISMCEKNGKILVEGIGDPAGLEVAGNVKILQRDLGIC